MSFYRSQTVSHYKLILPRDNAQQIMQILGENNLIHISPKNSINLDKPYINQIKRINDCLIKLKDIERLLLEKKIISKKKDFTNHQFQMLFKQWHSVLNKKRLSITNFLGDIDSQIEQMWKFYQQATNEIQKIRNNTIYIRENIAIIKAGSAYFGQSFGMDNKYSQLQQFQFPQMNESEINIKVGVTHKQKQHNFKKTIFRISQNNCFIKFFPFSQIFSVISSEQQVNKVVFFLLFSGPKDGFFYHKISKVISTYCIKDYNLPINFKNLQEQIKILQKNQQQNAKLLKLNQTELTQYLQNISQFLPKQNISKIESIKLYLIRQKQIYNQLNQMQLYKNFIQGDIFILRNDIVKLQKCFKEIEQKNNFPSGQIIQTQENVVMPSYFMNNSFMNSAQTIVQTYGIPCYKQANPAFFTAITFPFLFGVMFGDIGHGIILLMVGAWLISQSNKDGHGQILQALIPHRFIIFLMGFFSTYCGFIYNDFLSISLNIFISCYNVNNVTEGNPIPRISDNCVYPMGIDPVWSVSTNQLNYVSSLKMKISVIIGVLHMALGVLIKASNSLYFHKLIDVFFQFLPQLTFLLVLFGYMDFLIVYKWFIDWQKNAVPAPSIITTMINVGVKFGNTQKQPMWGEIGNTSQDKIQLFILILSILCIPVMFLPKSLLLIRRNKTIQNNSDEIQQLIEERSKERQEELLKQSQQKQTNNEIFIHQFISTTQYALGCISNTASYLRLWALSLAHSQLSEVLFFQTAQRGIVMGYSGIPIVNIVVKQMIGTFPVLAAATFGILLCMDSMECFLHALRLHWVEFQNKFYQGSGYKFEIFSFKNKINQQIKSD